MANGAAAGAIDTGFRSTPPVRGAKPIYAGGVHVGWVYKLGRGWWSQYGTEKPFPSPAATQRDAAEKVERNHAARTGRPAGRVEIGGAPGRELDQPRVPRANIYDRNRLQQVRASTRSAARRAQEDWERELDQRVGDLGWRIQAPERRERRPERVGGGYRSKQAGSYDWFYELDPKEQARIRRNWMSSSSSSSTPDEIEQRVPITEWLNLTRGVDMAKAIQTGRHVNRRLYGGKTPESLIAGEPYDLRELHHQDDERAAHHVRRARVEGRIGRRHAPENEHNVRRGIAYKADGTLDVQFFTDEDGRVHPIRASYETMTAEERRRHRVREHTMAEARRTGRRRYFNRATGTFHEYEHREDDDQDF